MPLTGAGAASAFTACVPGSVIALPWATSPLFGSDFCIPSVGVILADFTGAIAELVALCSQILA